MKNKKAFSIVEAVIALTVVLIISVSVISIITVENSKSNKNAEASYCVGVMSNALEIFKASEDETSFSTALNNLYSDFKYDSESEKYILKLTSYKIEIDVGFLLKPYTFLGLCIDNDGKEAAKVEYKNERC